MEITIIHGQNHKGSTYNITKELIKNIADKDTVINEFFMITDTPSFCVGCFNCFAKGEEFCPHYEKVNPIAKAMERSDLIIVNSPTYVYEMTGQLKTLFDHFGYMWLVHRPRGAMFKKVAVAISCTAGAGADRVTKSIAKQFFWFGIPTVFRYNIRVLASNWNDVKENRKEKIKSDCAKLAKRINKKIGKSRPNFKQKFMFNIMRSMQNKSGWSQADRLYWEKSGWLFKNRPWQDGEENQ